MSQRCCGVRYGLNSMAKGLVPVEPGRRERAEQFIPTLTAYWPFRACFEKFRTYGGRYMPQSKSAPREEKLAPGALKLKPAAEYLGGLSVPTMHRLIQRGLLITCFNVSSFRHVSFGSSSIVFSSFWRDLSSFVCCSRFNRRETQAVRALINAPTTTPASPINATRTYSLMLIRWVNLWRNRRCHTGGSSAVRQSKTILARSCGAAVVHEH